MPIKKNVLKLGTGKDRAAARVAIAKDVIAQLDARKLKAKYGYGYFEAKVRNGDAKPGADLQTLLKEGKVKSCTVCGLGSLFMGYVNLYDGVKLQQADGLWGSERSEALNIREQNLNAGEAPRGYKYIYRGRPEEELKKIFGQDMLNAIERYFEDGDGNNGNVRLRKIMQNIIDNKGEFTLLNSDDY